jgi:hypothetical protein
MSDGDDKTKPPAAILSIPAKPRRVKVVAGPSTYDGSINYVVPKRPKRKPRKYSLHISERWIDARIADGTICQRVIWEKVQQVVNHRYRHADAVAEKWSSEQLPTEITKKQKPKVRLPTKEWTALQAATYPARLKVRLDKRYAALTPEQVAKRETLRRRQAASRARLKQGLRLVPLKERPHTRVNPDRPLTSQERVARYLSKAKVKRKAVRLLAVKAYNEGRWDAPELLAYLKNFDVVLPAKPPDGWKRKDAPRELLKPWFLD